MNVVVLEESVLQGSTAMANRARTQRKCQRVSFRSGRCAVPKRKIAAGRDLRAIENFLLLEPVHAAFRI